MSAANDRSSMSQSGYESMFISRRLKERHAAETKRTSSVSMVLLSNPTACEGSKLNLVGYNITTIDKLPESMAAKVKNLYLSTNCLRSLSGLEQFTNITTLSLASNSLKSLDDIAQIYHLTQLEKVSFDQNEVVHMPYYREFIIGIRPSIKVIDGVKISQSEKMAAKSKFVSIISTLENLRLMHLQSLVLTHAHGLIRCHCELSEVVNGRFRILRGSFIPSSQDCPITSLSSILYQSLYGGVYTNMMKYCYSDFGLATQVLARRAYLSLLKKMDNSARAQCLSSYQSISLVWDEATKECSKYQIARRSGLLNACDSDLNNFYLKKFGNPNAIPSSSKVQHDIPDLLAKLNFVKSTDFQHQQFHGVINTSAVNVNSAIMMQKSYDLTSTKENFENADLSVLNRSRVHGASPNMLRFSSESLPRQQREPESDNAITDSSNSCREKITERLHWDDKEIAAKIGEYISRALCPLKVDEAHLNDSYEKLFDIRSVGPSPTGALYSELGPRPEMSLLSYASIDTETNMKAMKGQINTMFHELAVHQRNYALIKEVNDAHKKQAIQLNKNILENVEKAVKVVKSVQNQTVVLRDDLLLGSSLIEKSSTTLAAIEKEKLKLKDIEEIIIKTKVNCAEIYKQIEDEKKEVLNLSKSEKEADNAIAAIDKRLSSSSSLKAVLRDQHVMNIAMKYWEKGLHLQKRIIRMLQFRCRRQDKIRKFWAVMKSKRRREALAHFLKAWKYLAWCGKITRKIGNKWRRKVVRKSFKDWRSLYKVSLKEKRAQKIIRKKKLLKFLSKWRKSLPNKKIIIKKDQKYRQIIRKCILRRCFYGLKRYGESFHEIDEVTPSNGLKAKKFFLCSTFTAWNRVCSDAQALCTKLCGKIERRVVRKTKRQYMIEWKGLTFLNNYFRIKTMSKYFKRLGTKAAKDIVFNEFYSLACTYFFRKKAYRALKHWRRSKNRSKRRKAISHILASKRCNRLIQQVWSKWSEIHSTMPKVLLKMVTMKPLKPWRTDSSAETPQLQDTNPTNTTAFRSRRYRYSHSDDANLSQSITVASQVDASLNVTADTTLNTTSKKSALDKYRTKELTTLDLIESDDDDDDKDDNKSMSTQMAAMKTMRLTRSLHVWNRRSRRRSLLSNRAQQLRRKYNINVSRGTFNILLAKRTQLMMSRVSYLKLSKNLNSSQHFESMCAVNEAVRAAIKSDRERSARLQEELSSILRGQEDLLERVEFSDVTCQDLRATNALLGTELVAVSREAERLKAESSSILSAYERDFSSGNHGGDVEKATSALDPEIHTLQTDIVGENLSLMHDVESLYDEAVAIQNNATKRKGHISSSAQSAIDYCMRCKGLIHEFDVRIHQLNVERLEAEELLQSYKNTLADSISSIANTVQRHEEDTETLLTEKEKLLALVESIETEERDLSNELDALSSEISGINKAAAYEDEARFSTYELLAVDYVGQSQAFLSVTKASDDLARVLTSQSKASDNKENNFGGAKNKNALPIQPTLYFEEKNKMSKNIEADISCRNLSHKIKKRLSQQV